MSSIIYMCVHLLMLCSLPIVVNEKDKINIMSSTTMICVLSTIMMTVLGYTYIQFVKPCMYDL